MEKPPKSKREHLRRLVTGTQQWDGPLSAADQAGGFRGWHERGYPPHCDKPGLVQSITFRLWDSMPASRNGEWEHLLALAGRSDAPRSAAPTGARSLASPVSTKTAAQRLASREQRIKLEDYLERGRGECFLCDARIATLMDTALRFHHGSRFELLAWVVMPNHIHALIQVGSTPLSKIIQDWKSIVAVQANTY